MSEELVVQVLLGLSIIFAAIYAAGKDLVGTAAVKIKTLGLAVVAFVSAWLVQVTDWLS